MKENNTDIPFQVQTLIDAMKNKKEGDHIRGNYRMRLDSIRKAIDQAIRDFDNEVSSTMLPKRAKR